MTLNNEETRGAGSHFINGGKNMKIRGRHACLAWY